MKLQNFEEAKKKEKIEDKKFLENYSLLLDKQDKDRKQERLNRLNHIQKIVENNPEVKKFDEKALILEEKFNQKYLREKKEIDEK